MNKVDKTYVELLLKIKEQGFDCESAREGMPGTRAIFGEKLEFDNEIYPILQGKKVSFKNIISELIWFLKGDTNVKFLRQNKNYIWDKDAYKYYKRLGGIFDFEKWCELVDFCNEEPAYTNANDKIVDTEYYYGDCGRIYGYQWRNLGKYNFEKKDIDGFISYENRHKIDQIDKLIKGLIENPFSHYHIVDSWNIQDFSENYQCLPACHTNFMCNVFRINGELTLDLSVNIRSSDVPLGLPYNIASYALLQKILCELIGYKIGKLMIILGNTHYYKNQIEYIDTYIDRFNNGEIPNENVQVEIDSSNWRGNIDNINLEDFKLVNYKPLSVIKAPLSVGL